MRISSYVLPIVIALVAFGALVSAATPAFACEAGYCVQSTLPANGAAEVPVDAQIFVYFDTTPGFGEPEGSLVLVEADTRQGVLASVEVFAGQNPAAEVQNRVAVLSPLISMLPDTEYEVVFADGSVCDAPSLRFTTGTSTAPAVNFAGATGLNVSCVTRPAEVTSCDDQAAFPRVSFELDAEPAQNAAGYAIYRDGVRISTVAALPARAELLPDEVGSEVCLTLRAIGLAGVEDTNEVELCTMETNVCPRDQTEDAGTSSDDVGTTGGDMGLADVGVAADMGIAPDLGVPDSGAAPGATNASSADDDGCGCASSGARHDAVWAFLVLAALTIRRRR